MSDRPSFGRRLAASLIDYLIVLAWMAVIGIIALASWAITGSFVNWLALGTTGAEVLGLFVLVIPVGIYLYATEAGGRQATLGKRVMSLFVVNAASGERPGRARILVRTIVKLLPWEVAHFFVWQVVARSAAGAEMPTWVLAGLVVANVLPVLYLFIVGIQRQRRGPHDLVAGTRVIRGSRTSGRGAALL